MNITRDHWLKIILLGISSLNTGNAFTDWVTSSTDAVQNSKQIADTHCVLSQSASFWEPLFWRLNAVNNGI